MESTDRFDQQVNWSQSIGILSSHMYIQNWCLYVKCSNFPGVQLYRNCGGLSISLLYKSKFCSTFHGFDSVVKSVVTYETYEMAKTDKYSYSWVLWVSQMDFTSCAPCISNNSHLTFGIQIGKFKDHNVKHVSAWSLISIKYPWLKN